MGEYVISEYGDVYRRIYVMLHDGEEIGVLTSSDAVSALIGGVTAGGGECEDIYYNEYLQPIKYENWFSDSLHAVEVSNIAQTAGKLKTAYYTGNGWKAYDEV